MRAGERVRRYTSDYSAIIDLPGRKRSVAESVLPLVTAAPGGGKVPVDLSLDDVGGDFAPSTPLVPVKLAKDAREGFSLPGAGITVRPTGARASTASLNADKAFYANVLPDADMLSRPTPAGVETYTVLRSVDSPEDLTFSLTLPAGAGLRLVPGRTGFGAGAAVTRDGTDLLVIPPPVARDADGQSVPAAYRVSGNALTVHVPHRGGDFRYPLLVDPDWRIAEQFSNTNGWHFIAIGGPYFSGTGSYYYGSPVPTYGWRSGMIVQAPTGAYQLNSYGNLYWTPPTDAYIYRGEFQFVTYGWVYQAVNQGLWLPNGQPEVSRQTATNMNRDYWTVCPPGANPTCDPFNGTTNNILVLGLQNIYATANYGFASAATMEGALLYERDHYNPVVTGLSQNAPSTWVDTVAMSATATGTDRGLGMKEFAWVQPDLSQITSTHSCPGSRAGPCPSS